MSSRVIVVGLGPAGEGFVNGATREAIGSVARERQFLRTRRHPAAALLADAHSFDGIYDDEPTLDAVYKRIVECLVDAARGAGEVLYAVPGAPAVAERTVELLIADERVETELIPAMSFIDLAWSRLRIDPIAEGVRVVDGQSFDVEAGGARGPFLVAQCDSKRVLSDVKLAIDVIDVMDRRDDVIVLHHLGLPDETITRVAWHDLDRVVAPDHLTSLYVPTLAEPIAVEVQRFAELVVTLRRECPWDREQTHDSLKRHLLEEAYEVLDALDHVDPESGAGYEHLEEELGDLLFQILFHATLATEAGQFTLADVARTVHDKLYARHPHVFGEVPDGLQPGGTAAQVAANWEQLKKAEKGRSSVFDGIPDVLPALLYALKVQKKAATLGELGVDLPAPAKWDPVVFAARRSPSEKTIGELLFAVVSLARHAGVDPEAALRAAASRYRDDVKGLEG
ncbi:MAG: MazG family protein [Actinobacteria bacterium]|nr:MazG family protein [Actinomycetota bacterium]